MAEFAGEALESVHLIEAGLGLDARETVGDLLRDGGNNGAGWGEGFDEEGDFATDAVACGEVAAGFGYGGAQKLFVNLGELASDDDAEAGAEDGLEVGERVEDAMRGFIEDEGARGWGVGCLGS